MPVLVLRDRPWQLLDNQSPGGSAAGILGRVEQKMRGWIRADFGLDVTELTPIHHGADTAAEVWNADDRHAVKWSTGGTDAGPRTTAHLAAVGVRGVPAPVTTTTGQLWSNREGKRLSLAPWIAGARAAETGLTTDQWVAYGALLAEVHSTEPPAPLRALLPPLNPINARMPALIRALDLRLRTERPGDDLEAELATVWLQHHQTIMGVLKQAEDLATEELGGTPVICHADPHLGNVLVAPTQLHLIDWDDAVLAPPEQDLMFMLGGMGYLGPTTPAHQTAFLTGYGEYDINSTRLTYYRTARALEDIALWAEQALKGPDREDSLQILQGVLGPDGLAIQCLRA
jgi:spectinomycin phosphotransferase